MIKYFFFAMTVFIAAAVEATIVLLPITLLVLILLFVLSRSRSLAFAALFGGLCLDVLSLRILGSTSIFFLFFLVLLHLYSRKFEVSTPLFIVLASFIGTLSYGFIFQPSHLLYQAFIGTLFTTGIFVVYDMLILRRRNRKTMEYSL